MKLTVKSFAWLRLGAYFRTPENAPTALWSAPTGRRFFHSADLSAEQHRAERRAQETERLADPLSSTRRGGEGAATSPQIPIISCLLLCLAFAMNTHAASDKVLFDFTTTTNSPAWQIVNDDVMGGVSTSRFQVSTNGAVFSGVVSLENNGGFASVRSSPARLDLAGCGTFLIRVRGDGRRYKFTARTDLSFDSPIYQIVFTTKKGEWEEHRLPMKDMVPTFRGRVLSDEPPLDPAKVASVGFLISDKQDGRFQLELAWIKASARAGN